jgi:hypothetical protein
MALSLDCRRLGPQGLSLSETALLAILGLLVKLKNRLLIQSKRFGIQPLRSLEIQQSRPYPNQVVLGVV